MNQTVSILAAISKAFLSMWSVFYFFTETVINRPRKWLGYCSFGVVGGFIIFCFMDSFILKLFNVLMSVTASAFSMCIFLLSSWSYVFQSQQCDFF